MTCGRSSCGSMSSPCSGARHILPAFWLCHANTIQWRTGNSALLCVFLYPMAHIRRHFGCVSYADIYIALSIL